jgi:hypothetical protein
MLLPYRQLAANPGMDTCIRDEAFPLSDGEEVTMSDDGFLGAGFGDATPGV